MSSAEKNTKAPRPKDRERATRICLKRRLRVAKKGRRAQTAQRAIDYANYLPLFIDPEVIDDPTWICRVPTASLSHYCSRLKISSAGKRNFLIRRIKRNMELKQADAYLNSEKGTPMDFDAHNKEALIMAKGSPTADHFLEQEHDEDLPPAKKSCVEETPDFDFSDDQVQIEDPLDSSELPPATELEEPPMSYDPVTGVEP